MFEEVDEREEDPRLFQCDKPHAPFVGRCEVKVQIKEDIKKKDFQIFQITGGAVIGKSRLAGVVAEELYQESLESCTNLTCVPLSLRNKTAECLELMKLKILQDFGKEDYSQRKSDFFEDARETLKTIGAGKYFLIIMDDCDQMISDGSRTAFIGLVYTLVKSSTRVKVVLTSREKFDFPRMYNSVRHYHLTGLTDAECIELLTRSAPNVQFSSHEPLIIKHCSGLPLLLIILARTLEEHKEMLSKEDFLKVLQKFPLNGWNVNRLSHEDSIEKIMEQCVARLDHHLKESLSILSYFPGSFSAEAGAAVIGISSVPEAKLFKILPLHKKSMVEFDSTKRRYSILPVIRHYAFGQLEHLRDPETVRYRFCQYFSAIIRAANINLFEKPMTSVVSVIYDDWANIEKTLREASQPVSDLFAMNMKIVLDAPDVITALVPELAESYYSQCKSAAELFGTEFDVACINSCLGASIGNIKGNQLKYALDILIEAEQKIPVDSGYQRVKLMNHIEWNLYRQGRMKEAIRYQDLGLAVEASGADRSRIQRLHVNIQNHRALTSVLQGRTDEAIKTLKEAIKSTNKNHPAVKFMLNSLGLAFSEQNDKETALKYFLASLTERRKSTVHDKRNLVIPLINVGTVLLKRQKHALAVQSLNEAVEIRQNLEWMHLDTAMAVYGRGKILRKCGRYEEALTDLQDALSIYKQCVDTHWILAGVRVEIARCLKSLGQLAEAEHLLKEVINDKIHLEPSRELDMYIIKAFDQLMEITADRTEIWEIIAQEKCIYYQSLIQEEKKRDVADKYTEELFILREKIKEKIDTETLRNPTCFKDTTDIAVYKLLRVEGHPHNVKCKAADSKSRVKEIDTGILNNESKTKTETMADQALEQVGSYTKGTAMESNNNDKIMNIDPPVGLSRDGNVSNEISGSGSVLETVKDCKLSTQEVFCLNELSVDSVVYSINLRVHDAQPMELSQGHSIEELEELCSNVQLSSSAEMQALKQNIVRDNPCNKINDISGNKFGGSLDVDGLICNSREMYESPQASLCTTAAPSLSCGSDETCQNHKECSGENALNLKLDDFVEAKHAMEICENSGNGNVDDINCDLAWIPVDMSGDGQVNQLDSETSTITGSYVTSMETVLHLSLNKKNGLES